MKSDSRRILSRAVLFLVAVACSCALGDAQTTLTIATVNNADMIRMQQLSGEYTRSHPGIQLNWVVLEENMLRAKTTADITSHGGQYDVVTLGALEAPLWGERGWLAPLGGRLPSSYEVDDILKPVRDSLSVGNELYALPFNAESSMLFYRTDLFRKAGLQMPAQPTYADVERFAAALHHPDDGIYGVCLRGKPGWGENMAYFTTLVNTFGGRWFDAKWTPQLDSAAWQKALAVYIHLLREYGPPAASSNGFNENLTLFENGHCAMWIDASTAAGTLFDPRESAMANKVAVAPAPTGVTPLGSHWLWTWALAIPVTSTHSAEALAFIEWATSHEYIELVGSRYGWAVVPPGTRNSTYRQARYLEEAPFARLTLQSILSADPRHSTVEPVPYTGVAIVTIPQYPNIGTQVGQLLAAALTGLMSPEQTLRTAQNVTQRVMRRAGYLH